MFSWTEKEVLERDKSAISDPEPNPEPDFDPKPEPKPDPDHKSSSSVIRRNDIAPSALTILILFKMLGLGEK